MAVAMACYPRRRLTSAQEEKKSFKGKQNHPVTYIQHMYSTCLTDKLGAGLFPPGTPAEGDLKRADVHVQYNCLGARCQILQAGHALCSWLCLNFLEL